MDWSVACGSQGGNKRGPSAMYLLPLLRYGPLSQQAAEGKHVVAADDVYSEDVYNGVCSLCMIYLSCLLPDPILYNTPVSVQSTARLSLVFLSVTSPTVLYLPLYEENRLVCILPESIQSPSSALNCRSEPRSVTISMADKHATVELGPMAQHPFSTADNTSRKSNEQVPGSGGLLVSQLHST